MKLTVIRFLFLICTALISIDATAQSVQQSECLPHLTKENSKWPVRAIYLHGLFKGAGGPDTYGWRQLEAANRRKLEKMARKLHFRIAVPVAPILGATRVHQWNTTDLPQIEAAAARACGRKLSPKRAIIGFSNGGYRARKIGLMPCSKLANYEMILAIGAPSNTRGSSCSSGGHKKLINVTPHSFDERMVLDKLAALSPVRGSESQSPEAPPLPPSRPADDQLPDALVK